MKSSNLLLSILTVFTVSISFCSCSSKEYHTRSKITLIEETTSIVTTEQTQKSVTKPIDTKPTNNKVYYTKSCKCYHYINPCGRGTYFECSLEEAKDKGLVPCDKCVK